MIYSLVSKYPHPYPPISQIWWNSSRCSIKKFRLKTQSIGFRIARLKNQCLNHLLLKVFILCTIQVVIQSKWVQIQFESSLGLLVRVTLLGYSINNSIIFLITHKIIQINAIIKFIRTITTQISNWAIIFHRQMWQNSRVVIQLVKAGHRREVVQTLIKLIIHNQNHENR